VVINVEYRHRWIGIFLAHIEKTLASIVKINEDMSGLSRSLPHLLN